MGDIPQSKEDLTFEYEDFGNGCQTGIYEKISEWNALAVMRRGGLIFSAFVIWKEGAKGRKGRFVVKLSRQSKHWAKVSVRKESPA